MQNVNGAFVNPTKEDLKEIKSDATPMRKACHICHGQGFIWKGEDTIDCMNPKCDNGYVMIEIKAR